jgi:hypothetical protein
MVGAARVTSAACSVRDGDHAEFLRRAVRIVDTSNG